MELWSSGDERHRQVRGFADRWPGVAHGGGDTLYPLLAPTCAAPNEVKQGDCQATALKIYQRSPIPKERLRVNNWIVQGLYDDAVKQTVEL